jgi:hypothetical protein
VFTARDRDRVRDRVLELAEADERVAAAAVVGGLALGGGDDWSGIDLTFAVADGVPVTAVLDDWRDLLGEELDALHLFDLASGAAVYRVFLLPGGLQVDLSCSPASRFGATSPRFRLLFGESVELPPASVRPTEEIFGSRCAHPRPPSRACSASRPRWPTWRPRPPPFQQRGNRRGG